MPNIENEDAPALLPEATPLYQRQLILQHLLGEWNHHKFTCNRTTKHIDLGQYDNVQKIATLISFTAYYDHCVIKKDYLINMKLSQSRN